MGSRSKLYQHNLATKNNGDITNKHKLKDVR